MSAELVIVSGGTGPHAGIQVAVGGVPLSKAAGAVVVLHGRGGRAADLIGVAGLVAGPNVALLGPGAQNGTWYPHRFIDPEQINQPFLDSAISVVDDLVARIVQRVPPHRVMLLGFSQGACLALECATRSPVALGGVIAFSGGLIGAALDASRYPRHHGMRVFLSSADQDPHIPVERVRQSAALLRRLGADVVTKLHPGRDHGIREIDIEDAAQMIAAGASAG